jgi:uncharacterized membrane protein
MRLSYIIGPLIFLFLALALSACFYPSLPPELATHFEIDGTPDGWLSREMTLLWTLLPQLVFVLVAWGVAWGVTRLSRRFGQMKGTGVRAERVVLFMGNIIALPQLLLCFAMADIFSYNLYQRHIMPIWIFPIVALGLVTIAVGMFLFYIFSKLRGERHG